MARPVTSPRPVGRPAQISKDRILAAVSSTESLDTLTMRGLAAELGVTHGALYRWVKNRDELIDLVGDVLTERIVSAAADHGRWRQRLTLIAWRMHDEILALPGYATHLSRPHRHNDAAADRLRTAIVDVFEDSGVTPALAEQSYYVYLTSIVGWLAFQEQPHHLGPSVPRFDLFLDALLRGLPVREPGRHRCDTG